MKYKIKHINGTVLFGGDFPSLRACVEAAAAQRANLYGASLSGASLYGADLYRANLYRADLYRANLYGADLCRANLYGANLSRADLSGANLSGANLSRANLSRADLSRANLSRADLSGADLSGANLYGADLSGANLSGAKNASLAIAKTRILPQGSIIGWKKLANGRVAKLRIPEDAKRSHAWGRKCRAEWADVLAVFDDKGQSVESGMSTYGGGLEYKVGATVRPHKWCEDYTEECAGGIHFFITREEAEEYKP